MTWGRFPGREGEDYGPPPPPFRIQRRPALRGFGGYNRWIILAVALLILYVTLSVLKSLYVDWLWFEGAGYRSVFARELTARVGLFVSGVLLFLLFFGGNVLVAARLALRTPGLGLSEPEAAALRRIYQVALIATTLFLAVIFGSIASDHWRTVLAYLNAQPFGVQDPQFGRDIGFYVFTLPALNFFMGWLLGLGVLTTLAVAGLYLFRYLVVGPDVASVRQTKLHISLLLAGLVALFIWRYWINIYELTLSPGGLFFGATYTDIHARLPFIYVGMALAVVTAAALLVAVFRRGVGLPLTAMGVWVAVMAVGSEAYAAGVQRFSVDPDELEKERSYIQRHIDSTRAAFGLDRIEERPFPAAHEVTLAEIEANPDTINNIRLLDVGPLKDTYTQIQTIRPLYEFNDVDVDRYVIEGVRRQVMIAARELSPDRLPPDAQSWVNRRLQFTHGYGVVVSPVNEVVQEGLPALLVRDIPVTGVIPVTRPQIYYGEQPEHYVIVNTRAQEFDYPLGDTNVQTVFQGEGGVRLANVLRRAILAWHFQDLNILISGSLHADSRVLFRRNIQDRIRTIAPFLTLDNDPYIVIAEGRLFWIQDAYTTTSNYPYSRPAAQGFNYIRNSVKVIVDAYDGTTTFYLMEPEEPIAATYARIFPRLFTPLEQMPASLRSHIRYPEDLFYVQVDKYRTYHIKEAGVFYNREDIWNFPTELQGSRTEVQVEPYYVIMRIPGEPAEEFVLIMPLTPARRLNTIAWIAARSDEPNYGRLLAFRFPTDSLVFGPRQIESRIDQDPVISAQFSLWDQSGSSVIRGNLLMVPIGSGNLFVEPIYLRGEASPLPELKRVIVANGNRIAMEPTLDRSLEVLFGRAPPTRPVVEGQPGATGPPPAPTPTPAAPPTPHPPSPLPGAGAATMGELARQAEAAYDRAQEALRRNDFAAYGAEIAQVEALLRRMAQLAAEQ